MKKQKKNWSNKIRRKKKRRLYVEKTEKNGKQCREKKHKNVHHTLGAPTAPGGNGAAGEAQVSPAHGDFGAVGWTASPGILEIVQVFGVQRSLLRGLSCWCFVRVWGFNEGRHY